MRGGWVPIFARVSRGRFTFSSDSRPFAVTFCVRFPIQQVQLHLSDWTIPLLSFHASREWSGCISRRRYGSRITRDDGHASHHVDLRCEQGGGQCLSLDGDRVAPEIMICALIWHIWWGCGGRRSRPRTPTTGEVWRGLRPLQTSPVRIIPCLRTHQYDHNER